MRQETRAGWAIGGMIFAATMMLVIGAFQIFMGIAAIAKDEVFVASDGYIYGADTTTWGWIHLILGVLILLAGFFLYGGSGWARGVGIALAVMSAIGNFFLIPYYPVWSLLIIAMDIFVIWALASADLGRMAMREDMAMAGVPAGGVDGDAGGVHRASDQRWSGNQAGYGDAGSAARRAADVKTPETPPTTIGTETMGTERGMSKPGTTDRP